MRLTLAYRDHRISRSGRFFFLPLFVASICASAEPLRVIAVPPLFEPASVWLKKSGIPGEVAVSDHANAMKSAASDQADVVLTAQPLTAGDRAVFTAFPGRAAVQLPVGWEAISLVVHPENPLPAITEGQALALFVDPRCEDLYQPPAANWGELGGGGDWRNAPLRVLTPDPAHPAHDAFRSLLLGKCAPRSDAREFSTEALLDREAAADRFAIGVSSRVRGGETGRLLPLIASASTVAATASVQSVNEGVYPLARKIWLVMNHRPNDGSPQKIFLDFVTSAEGRSLLSAQGLFPLDDPLPLTRPGGKTREVSDPYRQPLRRLEPQSEPFSPPAEP